MHRVVPAPVVVPSLEQLVGLEPVGLVQPLALHVQPAGVLVPHVPGNVQGVGVELRGVVDVVVVVPLAHEVGVPLGGDEGVAHAGAVLDEAHGDVVGEKGVQRPRDHHVGVQVDASVEEEGLQTHQVGQVMLEGHFLSPDVLGAGPAREIEIDLRSKCRRRKNR